MTLTRKLLMEAKKHLDGMGAQTWTCDKCGKGFGMNDGLLVPQLCGEHAREWIKTRMEKKDE